MAIVIDVQLKGRASSAPITKMIDRVRSLKKEIDALNTSLAQTASLFARSASSARSLPTTRSQQNQGSSGGGGGRSAQATPMDHFRFWQQMNRSTKGGFQSQFQAALQNAVQFAQGQMASGQGAGFRNMGALSKHLYQPQQQSTWQKVMTAISTSRFSMSGGKMNFQPLVGRTAAALGNLGPGVMLASAAVTTFAQTLLHYSDKLGQAASSRAALGAGAGYADRAADALGLGSGSDLAGRLKSALDSPTGAAFGAQAGINPVGGPFGDNEYGMKLKKALEFIGGSKNFDEARRRAEGLGIPEAAKAYYLTPEQRARMGGFNGPSERQMQTGVRGEFERSEVGNAFDKTIRAMFSPIIDAFTGVAKTVKLFDAGLNRLGTSADALAGGLGDLWASATPLQAIGKLLNRFIDGDKKDTPLKENTKALNDNTRTMKDGRERFGGGNRAGDAVPRGLRGYQLNDPSQINGIRAGIRV